jgi:hypothetical protein
MKSHLERGRTPRVPRVPGASGKQQEPLILRFSKATCSASPTLGEIKRVVNIDCALCTIWFMGEGDCEDGNYSIDSHIIFIYFSISACHPEPINPQEENI